ncbi:MAG TPA: aminoglycoside phosphotransferase family protein [Anaerolineales bacterium]|jgi:spectinomycin phosphotransferase
MLEKPDIPDGVIFDCLQRDFGLAARRIEFLPLGYDLDSAVYWADVKGGKSYFVKLRSGVFDEMTVRLPQFLHECGIRQIIAPIKSKSGQPWANLDGYKLILSPFIEGWNGYQVELTKAQWFEFGATLKAIHATKPVPELAGRLQREAFSEQWRQVLKDLLERIDGGGFNDPIAAETAAFLGAQRKLVLDLVRRANNLADVLKNLELEFVLCHADAHAGNIHIGKDGSLYIVDWDNPILAPRERDLMFIGNSQGFRGTTPEEEEASFYRGYGNIRVDQNALAYYRYERIIQDIAIFCQQLLLSDQGGDDREQSFRYLVSNFEAGNTIELAYTTDKSIRIKG